MAKPPDEISNCLCTFKKEFYYDGKIENEHFELYEYRTFDLGRNSFSPIFTGTYSGNTKRDHRNDHSKFARHNMDYAMDCVAIISGLISIAAFVMTFNVLALLLIFPCPLLFLIAHVMLCVSAKTMFKRFEREVIFD
ncbi:MAG: hypothetical protein V8S89_03785 [Oscillospiraceae bacterium]